MGTELDLRCRCEVRIHPVQSRPSCGSSAGGNQGRAGAPDSNQLSLLIDRLDEPIATATWLIAVTSIRPEEIAFKWKDLNAEKRELKIVRAVNQGELHTPKYHRMNRPIRLTENDVERLPSVEGERQRARGRLDISKSY